MESFRGYTRNKGLRLLGSKGPRGRRWDRLVVVWEREGEDAAPVGGVGLGGGDHVNWLLPQSISFPAIGSSSIVSKLQSARPPPPVATS